LDEQQSKFPVSNVSPARISSHLFTSIASVACSDPGGTFTIFIYADHSGRLSCPAPDSDVSPIQIGSLPSFDGANIRSQVSYCPWL
jgi:hypothetical protein